MRDAGLHFPFLQVPQFNPAPSVVLSGHPSFLQVPSLDRPRLISQLQLTAFQLCLVAICGLGLDKNTPCCIPPQGTRQCPHILSDQLWDGVTLHTF